MLFKDFSSAYNIIVPQYLIGTLSLLGLNTFLFSCILDFLIEGPLSLWVRNSITSTTKLRTEGPNGYVLSPILFTLLTAVIHSLNHIKFASDKTWWVSSARMTNQHTERRYSS